MKIFKNKFFLGMIFMSVLLCLIAAKPGGITQLTSLWVGDPTDTADVTPGVNDLFVSGTAEIDGATRIDGAIDANSTMNVSGAATFQSTLSATTITGTGTEFGTGTISSTEIADTYRYVHLPLSNFAIETAGGGSTVGTGWTAITGSTTPGFELDDNVINLNWADGETSPVQQTFTVPADYASGGDFLAAFTLSTADILNSMDFDVYVNTPSNPGGADSAATDQTAVVLPAMTNTLQQVTFTVTTDFASLAAGDRVTLRLWGGAGASDKEMKGDVLFRYTAIQ